MSRLERRRNPLYKTFDHTADVGFDVCGATRKVLFSHAAAAVLSLLTDLASVEPRDTRPLAVSGSDIDDLWMNYLREILNLFNGEGFLVRTVEVLSISRKRLAAVVRGEPFDRNKHEILTEIKAVTYHQAGIKKTPAGWTGRFIVDV